MAIEGYFRSGLDLEPAAYVLGRNFLNYCDFRMNKPNNLVEIEPLAIP